MFNGVADGASGDTDAEDAKDLVGRVFIQPFRNTGHHRLEGLGFGLAATSGRQGGVPGAPGLGAYRSPGQQTFFAFRSDGTTPGTVLAGGRRYRVGPQGHFYTGRLGVLAEYYVAHQQVVLATRADDIAARSWQVSGSFVLTGERPTFRGIIPKADFDPRTGSWGALEVTARAGGLSVDDAAFPVYADPATAARKATTWGVGLNWYLNRGVRLTASYEETSFKGGSANGSREAEKLLFTLVQFSY